MPHADGVVEARGVEYGQHVVAVHRLRLARISVSNEMDVATSMHWHGLLVPPTMDGVPYVTQVPIEPGATFVYEFPIRQTGTYWYHSHSQLQEQSGTYGSIVIEDGAGTYIGTAASAISTSRSS